MHFLVIYVLGVLESVMEQWGLCGRFISIRRPFELLSLWVTSHNVQINDECRYGMYFIAFHILHNENIQVVAFSWLFLNFIYNEHVFQFLYTVIYPY